MMDDKAPGEYHPIFLHAELKRVSKQVEIVQLELAAIKASRAADEKQRLKWGISALGTVVLVLGTFLWQMLPGSAQEAWDVFRNGNGR